MELLATAWYIIIGFCILMYVLLDGFDLGIGIMFPFFEDKEQNIMMSTILPVWDGNQTWSLCV
jgi:cytochrome d ubiquinol oxidase subunit II